MKKLLIYFLTLFYLSTLLLPPVVFATQNTSVVPKNIILFNEDQKFSLPKNSVSYWFNIPKGAELTDCYVNLHISFSNTLITNRSNITVLINDSPVDTKWINDLKATNWWKVSIPLTMLRGDAINELKIQSNQRSIEGDCADIDNTSNWMTIYKDSFMETAINKYADAILSNALPIYGDNLLNKYMISSDFVLPKTVNRDSLSSLLKLSSSIGKIYNDKTNLDYNVLIEKDDDSSKNKIFLGPIGDWTTSKQVDLPAQKLSQSQGFISIKNQEMPKIVSNSDNTTFDMLVTGDNQEGIDKAINFLSSIQLMDQIKNNSLVINSDVNIQHTRLEEKKNGLYKFSDFGYGNINLSGAFHQKTYLTFVQPQGIQSNKGSYINVKFNHSKTLVSDRSILTVYINGIAVNSAKLSAANAEDGTLKVILPDEALKSNVINVGIECYNYLGVVDCSKDYDESAWTTISPESEICLLPGKEVIQPNLSSFPYFYTKQEKNVPQIALGLVDFSSPSILKAASLISTRAGQNTGETLNWNIIGSSDAPSSDQKKMDIIYLGSYKNINLPQNIDNQLFVFPSGNGSFRIKEGLEIQPETLQNKLLIQVVKSPWDPKKRLYVIMYDNDTNLNTLIKILSEGNSLSQMTGEIAVVDSDNEIHNFNYQESGALSSHNTIMDRIHSVENFTHLPWWLVLTFFITIIFGLIALIIFRKAKKRRKISKS